jgi:hypothetical protein
MKKLGYTLIFVVAFFGHAVLVHAEEIRNFSTDITVNRDSTINIVERIDYDFGPVSHHGIFRDIPYRYKTTLGSQTANISDINVTDENGDTYPFTTTKVGNDVEIRIGGANATITGEHIYVLHYVVNRALGYFQNYDEIYWNATGNRWNVTIDLATATVHLPSDIQPTQSSCYVGSLGSNESCSSVPAPDGLSFSVGRQLLPNEGLTVAVGFPKGVVSKPSVLENILNFVKDNIFVFLPVVVFIIMLTLWWKKGRDPKGSGVIVAEYDAPENLSPIEIASILSVSLPDYAISSEMIYLATKGYLKITKVKTEGVIFSKYDYEITLLKEYTDLEKFDTTLLQGLFATGNTVKLSSLKNIFLNKI